MVSRSLLTLTGLLALFLAGCSTNGGQQQALAAHQTFTWPYVNATAVNNKNLSVAVLDPAVITKAIDLSNISMLYSGLVTLDSSTLQVRPDAALSWDISNNGKTYVFHLRPNLFFSNGDPITANTFAYSIDRAIGPINSAGQSLVCTIDDAKTYGEGQGCQPLGGYYLGSIMGAQAKQGLSLSAAQHDTLIGKGPSFGLNVIDDRTLQINLTQPSAYFLEALDYPTSLPVDPVLVQKYPGGLWINHLDQGGCSGPFMVKPGGYTNGVELKLEPNPYWERAWGKQLTLKEVDRPFVTSQDTEYSQYHTTGQFDYTDVPSEDYTFAVGQSDFHQVPSLTTDYFGLNWKLPPFDNLQVRQAFDLALNKQLLVDRVFNGGALPTNHIVPEGNPGYDQRLTGPDNTQSVTGNQEKAQQLLHQAQQTCPAVTNPTSLPANLDYCAYIGTYPAPKGEKLLPIMLAAGTATDATQNEIATIATQTWSQVLSLTVSITVKQDLTDLVNYLFGTGTNPAQIWQIGWLADYPDPEDWLSLQFHTGSGNNIEYVSSKSEDNQMDTADADQNPTHRMGLYNTIEQWMVNEVAWIPYAQEKSSWRLRPWVQGFGLNEVLNMEDVDWPNVYILAH